MKAKVQAAGPVWLEVTIAAPDAARLGAASELLAGLGATGIWEQDPLADGRASAKAYLPGERVPLDATPLVRLGCSVIGIARIASEPWERTWREGLGAILVGERLVVVPEHVEAPEGRIPIFIDPGSAFGTGIHPSTRLAAAGLEEALAAIAAPASVLDVGTGSGILAIVAHKLGARPVLAIDQDPQAVEEAQRNARRNGCRDAFEASDRKLEAIEVHFDVVIANLDAPTLSLLGAHLEARVAPAGRLVVAGLREDDEWSTPHGLEVIATRTEDGWRSETLARRG